MGYFFISKTKLSYTIAETLLILVLIGIVAGFIIPSFVINLQNAQLKGAWKRAYSVMYQATNKIMIDNAATMTGLCADWDDDCIKNKYMNYLVGVKFCTNADAEGNCWPENAKYMDGTDYNYMGGPSVILNNGFLLNFRFYSQYCSNTDWQGIPVCGLIRIDINGLKGPNIMGKDIFGVWILENGIKSNGVQGDDYEYTCSSSSSGVGCSTKYLYQ